eukprot:CAMPEP_0197913748 /NCGR_PEP_ID=MMETSP1439-20131203/77159_1 /TAXON_ID=66791 /ORGANISM="Gonyaulax spinifera, Strain CCMP409" /LENGTH=484 /DNA_ID=CAMNT_0043535619 /DNA_START=50 /DNA_END=1504 /DNA_ORIENTATION=+
MAQSGPARTSFADVGLVRKTRLCKFFESGTCKRGRYCSFAHGEAELRPCPSPSETAGASIRDNNFAGKARSLSTSAASKHYSQGRPFLRPVEDSDPGELMDFLAKAIQHRMPWMRPVSECRVVAEKVQPKLVPYGWPEKPSRATAPAAPAAARAAASTAPRGTWTNLDKAVPSSREAEEASGGCQWTQQEAWPMPPPPTCTQQEGGIASPWPHGGGSVGSIGPDSPIGDFMSSQPGGPLYDDHRGVGFAPSTSMGDGCWKSGHAAAPDWSSSGTAHGGSESEVLDFIERHLVAALPTVRDCRESGGAAALAAALDLASTRSAIPNMMGSQMVAQCPQSGQHLAHQRLEHDEASAFLSSFGPTEFDMDPAIDLEVDCALDEEGEPFSNHATQKMFRDPRMEGIWSVAEEECASQTHGDIYWEMQHEDEMGLVEAQADQAQEQVSDSKDLCIRVKNTFLHVRQPQELTPRQQAWTMGALPTFPPEG